MRIDRRAFLARSVAAGAALALRRVAAADAPATAPAAIPTIVLGKTGRTVPRLGIGCYPLGNCDEETALAVLRRAFESGVRYVDTAPSYANGESERRVGRTLKDFPRDEFFVATKTLERTADGARAELEKSLERLGLDHVDSVQCHEVHDDVETLFEKDGALAGLAKAVEEKLVKHVGFTCHRNPHWANDAIAAPAGEDRFEFATALVPVNPIDPQRMSFVTKFLPRAAEKGVAVVAMKLFGGGGLLKSTALTADDCLRFAWCQPHVSVIVPGCDAVEQVDQAVAIARENPMLDDVARAAITARAGRHKGKASEWYKDSSE